MDKNKKRIILAIVGIAIMVAAPYGIVFITYGPTTSTQDFNIHEMGAGGVFKYASAPLQNGARFRVDVGATDGSNYFSMVVKNSNGNIVASEGKTTFFRGEFYAEENDEAFIVEITNNIEPSQITVFIKTSTWHCPLAIKCMAIFGWLSMPIGGILLSISLVSFFRDYNKIRPLIAKKTIPSQPMQTNPNPQEIRDR